MADFNNKLEFLEELRSIAQLGLAYARDDYDRGRYERLLEMAAVEYAGLAGLPARAVQDILRSELGYITPKVGVNAAVFSPSGGLLLSRRADDKAWELPGGWVDVRETPRQAIRREVMEELGLSIKAKQAIEVFGRMPGAFGQPHTSCHILFLCVPRGKQSISCNQEVIEAGYFSVDAQRRWHRDHYQMAVAAQRYRLNTMRIKPGTGDRSLVE